MRDAMPPSVKSESQRKWICDVEKAKREGEDE